MSKRDKYINLIKTHLKYTNKLDERINLELDYIFDNNIDKFIDKLLERMRTGDLCGNINKPNSLVCFYLKITNKPPNLKERWEFIERNELARASPPDVDIDFEHQGPVYEYLINKYGRDNVSNIGTWGTYACKKAIQYVSKSMDITGSGDSSKNYQEAIKISKTIPNNSSLKNIGASNELKAIRSKYPNMVNMASLLEGMISQAGVHAAGVVVCREPLTNYCPLHKTRGDLATQYDMNELEELGLLKFDVLGIATLELLTICLNMIKKNHGVDIDIDNIDINDKGAISLIARADTSGIFQLESMGMRRLLRTIRVTDFNDVVAANALFRPGPLAQKVHESYGENKRNPSAVRYLHPTMKKILEPTYGLCIYQEQLMQLSMAMANFTITEADTLRKGTAKKKPELIKKSRDQFIKGCTDNNIPKEISAKVFEILEGFGRYGFNKAHSTAYAVLAMQTAYLKSRYYAEFMASLLTINIARYGGDKAHTRMKMYIEECDKAKTQILPLNINASKGIFVAEKNGHIRMSFNCLKGLGENVIKEIVDNQPYKDFEDFFARTNGKIVTDSVYKILLYGDSDGNTKYSDKFDVIIDKRKKNAFYKMGDIEDIDKKYSALMSRRNKQKKGSKKINETNIPPMANLL